MSPSLPNLSPVSPLQDTLLPTFNNNIFLAPKTRSASEPAQPPPSSRILSREAQERKLQLQHQRRIQMLRGAYLELGEEEEGEDDEDESIITQR